MDEQTKKEVQKIFEVALFLFVTIIFVLPYLVQVSTYFHEKAHIKFLNKHGVDNYYYINLLATIPNFFNPQVEKLGVTRFDLEAYKRLDKYQRTEINVAGIVSDLKFLFLIGVYLTMANLLLFYKIKMRKNTDLTWLLAIDWILFMWLLALIQITVSNITYSSGDIYQLVRFLRV